MTEIKDLDWEESTDELEKVFSPNGKTDKQEAEQTAADLRRELESNGIYVPMNDNCSTNPVVRVVPLHERDEGVVGYGFSLDVKPSTFREKFGRYVAPTGRGGI